MYSPLRGTIYCYRVFGWIPARFPIGKHSASYERAEHMRPENKLLPHNLVWMRWRLVPYVSAANLLRIVFTTAMESIGKSAIDGLVLVRNDQVWWLNLFSFGLNRFTPIRLSISGDKKRFSHSEMAVVTNWFERYERKKKPVTPGYHYIVGTCARESISENMCVHLIDWNLFRTLETEKSKSRRCRWRKMKKVGTKSQLN